MCIANTDWVPGESTKERDHFVTIWGISISFAKSQAHGASPPVWLRHDTCRDRARLYSLGLNNIHPSFFGQFCPHKTTKPLDLF